MASTRYIGPDLVAVTVDAYKFNACSDGEIIAQLTRLEGEDLRDELVAYFGPPAGFGEVA